MHANTVKKIMYICTQSWTV